MSPAIKVDPNAIRAKAKGVGRIGEAIKNIRPEDVLTGLGTAMPGGEFMISSHSIGALLEYSAISPVSAAVINFQHDLTTAATNYDQADKKSDPTTLE